MRWVRFAVLASLLAGWSLVPPAASQVKKEEAKEVAETYDPTKSDIEMLKQAGVPDEGAALVQYFQKRTVGEPDRLKILALIRQLSDDSFDAREEASDRIEGFGISAIGLLRQAEREGDFEVTRRCERILSRIEKVPSQTLSSVVARRLAFHKPGDATEAMLAYLPFADDLSVANEVRDALAAVAMQGNKPNPILLAAMADPLPVRRGAAAEALASGGPAELYPRLKEFLRKETDLANRVRLAVALVMNAKQKDAVADLITVLGDAPQDVGWEAEDALCRIAGEDGGPKVSLGTDAASREKCRDAWKEWWAKNEGNTDLAKLEDRPRMLGFTLVMEMGVNGVNGRVVELGMDKEIRWKVEGLQFPIDAQVLPDGKVLIAEHNQHKVTEREIKTGKITWTKQVLMPVSLTRSPDGNTFVAARNQIYEWDRNDKQVFTHTRPQHDIVAATKLRNGDVVFVTNNGQLVRLNAKGEQIKTFSVGRVNYYSGIQALPNNRVLITQLSSVAEFDLDSGKSTWTVPVNAPTSVQRLPNGNTLVASMNTMKVLELDQAGKTVWDYSSAGNRPWCAKRR